MFLVCVHFAFQSTVQLCFSISGCKQSLMHYLPRHRVQHYLNPMSATQTLVPHNALLNGVSKVRESFVSQHRLIRFNVNAHVLSLHFYTTDSDVALSNSATGNSTIPFTHSRGDCFLVHYAWTS